MKNAAGFFLLLLVIFCLNFLGGGCRPAKSPGEKNQVVKQEFLDGEVMITKGAEMPQIDYSAYLGVRTIKPGQKGEDVKALQERLRLAGFVNYRFTTGEFDEITKKAVQEYRRGENAYLKSIIKPRYWGQLELTDQADLVFCRHIIRSTGYFSKIIPYQISPGETMLAIAGRYKIPLKELVLLNNLDPVHNFIRAGQTIFLILRADPSREKSYRVTPNEDLQQIADKFGLALSDLIKANCLYKGSLKVGDILYIPANPANEE